MLVREWFHVYLLLDFFRQGLRLMGDQVKGYKAPREQVGIRNNYPYVPLTDAIRRSNFLFDQNDKENMESVWENL